MIPRIYPSAIVLKKTQTAGFDLIIPPPYQHLKKFWERLETDLVERFQGKMITPIILIQMQNYVDTEIYNRANADVITYDYDTGTWSE